MMTPQEVASHAFAKAMVGGYNMAMVDEFLDLLTEDYTTLYNDNAILKSKLKVLSESVEEYRATDNAMRKTLLAAQQMADSIVAEAERKRDQILAEAKRTASSRAEDLEAEVKAEEYRLKAAQASTAAYVRKLTEMHAYEVDFLANLKELVPPDAMAEAEGAPAEAATAAAAAPEQADPPAEHPKEETPEPAGVSTDATRRFEDLQFGKDYEIQ